jgi:hypothetical protein
VACESCAAVRFALASPVDTIQHRCGGERKKNRWSRLPNVALLERTSYPYSDRVLLLPFNPLQPSKARTLPCVYWTKVPYTTSPRAPKLNPNVEPVCIRLYREYSYERTQTVRRSGR